MGAASSDDEWFRLTMAFVEMSLLLRDLPLGSFPYDCSV